MWMWKRIGLGTEMDDYGLETDWIGLDWIGRRWNTTAVEKSGN